MDTRMNQKRRADLAAVKYFGSLTRPPGWRFLSRLRFRLPAFFLLLALVSPPLNAIDKEGMTVNVSKRIINRNDTVHHDGIGDMEIDRTMTLRLDVKNTSRKTMAATTVAYTVLVQRWNFGEREDIESYSGTMPIEEIVSLNAISSSLGEYRIGGHMHGTSDRHTDRMLAWKVVIERDGKKVEVLSTPRFEALNKRATDKTKN